MGVSVFEVGATSCGFKGKPKETRSHFSGLKGNQRKPRAILVGRDPIRSVPMGRVASHRKSRVKDLSRIGTRSLRVVHTSSILAIPFSGMFVSGVQFATGGLRGPGGCQTDTELVIVFVWGSVWATLLCHVLRKCLQINTTPDPDREVCCS